MNEQEFMRLYDTLSDALFRHCYFRVYERERAKDLVQETFTRAWKYLGQGKHVENMRAFLYKVANNLIIDESRKKRALSLDALSEQGFDPRSDDHEHMERSAEIAELLSLVRDLDEEQRELIVLRFVDGLGPKEIAVMLDESENVISVRLNRAVARLRQIITHHGTRD